MSTLTPEQYIAKIQGQIQKLKDIEKNLNIDILDLHSRHAQSIFGDGLEGESYSTEEILVGGTVFGKTTKFGTLNYSFVTEKGKNKYFGSKKKRKAQEWVTLSTPKGMRRLMELKGGYKELREADGRQTNNVDLNRTGILFRDYLSSIKKVDGGWVSGVTKEENVGKLEGAIARYGEKLAIKQSLLDEFNKKFVGAMLEILK